MAFLGDAPETADARALYDDDRSSYGYVMDLSHLWAHHPPAHQQLFALLEELVEAGGLTLRQRAILVVSGAATVGDSYCSLAWGGKLATVTDPDLAAAVLRGSDDGLSPAEHAMATWARTVARDPNATTAADVEELRAAGWTDRQVFAITTFVALRAAFSTVNDALGAVPDPELRAGVPLQVRDAVTWGR
ncbi:carboxymuconolactone decarboxylase family protein [Nocardioides pantholopis]|uniref:carboxymuconolactone decarboxylase family protein n=1 Tax=Nocardioides pantholopis TaxID=2483798 RepID=UPI000F08B317|nr:hypothetical protein [Nocardioides pantholopis]